MFCVSSKKKKIMLARFPNHHLFLVGLQTDFDSCLGIRTCNDHLGLPKAYYVYLLGSKLPLFPYNRGWSSTQ